MDDPAGYRRLVRFDVSQYASDGASIFVPTPMADRINAARVRACDRPYDVELCREAVLTPRSPPVDPRALDPSPSPSGFVDPTIVVPAPSAPHLSARQRRANKGKVPVISSADIAERQARVKQRPKLTSEERQAESKFWQDVMSRGERRAIGLDRRWRGTLNSLGDDMPNFAPVVDRVAAACALCDFSSGPLRIPPLLLVGPPGVGKTLFAKRLAGVLGVDHFVYALESAETVAVLCGAEKHWAGADAGELFRLVVQGKHANPVVILDELDKANGGSSYRPMNALHAVLERATAERLRDKAADIEFDASYVIYIGTANRLSRVDATLLSRFELFQIDEPDARAAVCIARSIGRQVLQKLNLGQRFEPPSGEVVQQLALLGSPRRMAKVLEAALGRAVLAHRRQLLVSDLASEADDRAGRERLQ